MGRTKNVTVQQKVAILALVEGGRHVMNDIADQVGVSKRTVQRIKQAGVITNNCLGRCGLKRATTSNTDRMIRRQALASPTSTSHELAETLREVGINVSRRTLIRRLAEKGVVSKRPVSKPSLTLKMRMKRLRWAKQHRHWTIADWSKVCFSDESTFQCGSATTPKVWHQTGTPPPTKATVKYPTKVMMWSVMSAKGAGRLHVVEGMMNTEQYVHVLNTRLLAQVRDWFPGSRFTFMQDGAPCHTSKVSMAWLRRNNIPVLDWPGNSPDLNPIETLWGIVKRRLRAQTITTKNQLIAAIIKAWLRDATLTETCRKLVASMPDRVMAVIGAKGGHTKY